MMNGLVKDRAMTAIRLPGTARLMCTLAILLFSLLSAQFVTAQAANTPTEITNRASLHGIVRDSTNNGVSGATISLQQGKQNLTTLTDAFGNYRFSGLSADAYTIFAKLAGFEDVIANVRLGSGESRAMDLILLKKIRDQQAPDQGNDRNSIVTMPQFFDEPHFSVAGVTDTTNLGGHGSSVASVRNKDSIEKAAAALRAEPPVATEIDPTREKNMREEIQRRPQSFQANLELGKLLLDEGKSLDALPYVETAHRLNPNDGKGLFELARAHAVTGNYKSAQNELSSLLTGQMKPSSEEAEAHHLLGQVDEKLADPLSAVREFERAAEINPTERNLFDLGSELLLHHAPEPASEVFQKGRQSYPDSGRMLMALGASWYALGFFDKAAESLCAASDLSPNDPGAYELMGKMQATEGRQSKEIARRLERFLNLQPENALANYLYGITLWKRTQWTNDVRTRNDAKTLLLKSVELDPGLAPAFFQTGLIYAAEKNFRKAIFAYRQAIAIDPAFEDAHYRLAQAYKQAGETKKSRVELQAFETIKQANADRIARERQKTKQFIYQINEEKSQQSSH